MLRLFPRGFTATAICLLAATLAVAQEERTSGAGETPVAASVAVDPVAADERIATRLNEILSATGWFEDAEVRVDQGVAFLKGRSDTEAHREWAGALARNTEGVVAAVNRMEVNEVSMWDLSPAWGEIQELAAAGVRKSPLLLLALLVLTLTWWFAARWTRAAGSLLEPRIDNRLLKRVLSRLAAVPIALFGMYVVLKISGLTGLATTVLGGTGLIGLVLGIAFRDIAENFLASLMLSVQNPFATGDLISVAGHKGFVQSVNTRSTLLMTLDGNHVQIPNATIYKETIVNFTANPNTRFDFVVGIGYDDSIEQAQGLARDIVLRQEGVVAEPEPWVVVEALGASTVNIKAYFWVETAKYNGLKVRSAVIRSVKRALEDAGISMPDEAREVVFPAGVPVQMIESGSAAAGPSSPAAKSKRTQPIDVSEAEGSLQSEAVEIEEQARKARVPEQGTNLLGDEETS